MLHWFPAAFRGKCNACGKRFEEGAEIGYIDAELVGRECCAGVGITAIGELMPHGTTIADRCDNCFIIHATGQTQCE